MRSSFLNFNRIGRTRFLAYTNISYGLLALIYYFTFTTIPIDKLSFSTEFEQNPIAFIIISLASFLPLKFLVQRYKDAGVSGWWAMVGLLPTSYILLYFLMGTFKGEPYENRHGRIPSKAGFYFQLVAFIPILLFIGFIIWNLFLSKIN